MSEGVCVWRRGGAEVTCHLKKIRIQSFWYAIVVQNALENAGRAASPCRVLRFLGKADKRGLGGKTAGGMLLDFGRVHGTPVQAEGILKDPGQEIHPVV